MKWWRQYWRENRTDPIWWICVIGVTLSIFVLCAMPIVIGQAWHRAHAYCLPSKLHGYICKKD